MNINNDNAQNNIDNIAPPKPNIIDVNKYINKTPIDKSSVPQSPLKISNEKQQLQDKPQTAIEQLQDKPQSPLKVPTEKQQMKDNAAQLVAQRPIADKPNIAELQPILLNNEQQKPQSPPMLLNDEQIQFMATYLQSMLQTKIDEIINTVNEQINQQTKQIMNEIDNKINTKLDNVIMNNKVAKQSKNSAKQIISPLNDAAITDVPQQSENLILQQQPIELRGNDENTMEFETQIQQMLDKADQIKQKINEFITPQSQEIQLPLNASIITPQSAQDIQLPKEIQPIEPIQSVQSAQSLAIQKIPPIQPIEPIQLVQSPQLAQNPAQQVNKGPILSLNVPEQPNPIISNNNEEKNDNEANKYGQKGLSISPQISQQEIARGLHQIFQKKKQRSIDDILNM